jgi:glycosyltransferase involved in cell wall biosynthesis
MRLLYAYRYGILGGVCTQLINRLWVLPAAADIEIHLLFAHDCGISRSLPDHPFLRFARSAWKVRRLARKGDFDAAVVVDTPEYLDALSRVRGLPLILEVQTTYESGLRYLSERSWPLAGYVVPSEYSRSMLRRRFGIGDRERVRVVPNAVSADLFPKVMLDRVPNRPVFAWVGKLDAHKNWMGFLEVAAQIVSRGVEAEFWMIGGETAPPAVASELADRIDRGGLAGRCRWFPRIEYGEMHRVYAAARQSGGAKIVTSRNESFGMSVVEALMCGCPVVAPEVGAIPEIAPGRPYLPLYPGDRLDRAAELAIAMAQDESRRQLREELDRDREVLKERFSGGAAASRYLSVLRELIGRAGAKPRAKTPEGGL